MNAELPPFKNRKYNSEDVSFLDCGLTPVILFPRDDTEVNSSCLCHISGWGSVSLKVRCPLQYCLVIEKFHHNNIAPHKSSQLIRCVSNSNSFASVSRIRLTEMLCCGAVVFERTNQTPVIQRKAESANIKQKSEQEIIPEIGKVKVGAIKMAALKRAIINHPACRERMGLGGDDFVRKSQQFLSLRKTLIVLLVIVLAFANILGRKNTLSNSKFLSQLLSCYKTHHIIIESGQQ